MSRILIAGCGYLGERVADLLHAANWQVEGWTASTNSAERLREKPYPVRAVNIADAAAVSAAATNVDAVIQCVSSGGGGPEEYRRVYYQGALNLTRAFPQAMLLFTGSTSVYAQRDGSWVDETSPTEPGSETARILLETERIVLDQQGIVARLAGIYGPQRSDYLRKFLAGEVTMDPLSDRFINQVHRDDIARALNLLINRRESVKGNVFNVVDDRPFRAREVYEWLATHTGKPLVTSSLGPAAGKRGQSNKRVGNRKLRALGWVPEFPTFKDGLAKSVIPSFAGIADGW